MCIELSIAVVVSLIFPDLAGHLEPTFTVVILGIFALLIVNWIPITVLLHRHQSKGGGPMPIGKKGLSGYIDIPNR